MWKKLLFAWHTFWLRRDYMNRLDKATQDRFLYNRLGLFTRNRLAIHEWYAGEYKQLQIKYFKE